MIGAGDLNKVVILQNQTTTRNDYGESIVTWTNLATVWANVQLGSGREFFAAQKLNPELSGIMKIRYRSGVTATTRVVYGGRNFDIIKPPINIDECNEILELHVKEVIDNG